eukprot:TRINITY_DN17047_c0_g2_i1.p1 TRINITY_DN17047_c0_g2~~TRINITY_DN17047_c0_g2_i1.p1  ORF type:complete len:328 (+),score=97.22 TRINITY_DN17047_c0_g2_i1:151-1134(+)
MMDKSPATLSIKQAQGKRHVTSFARKHNHALQLSSTQRSASRAKVRSELELQLQDLLENRGLCDDVRRTFEFYSSYGEESVKDSLKSFMFYKMVRDCHMLDQALPYERVDLIFHQSIPKHTSGGSVQGRPRLLFSQFLLALSKLAKVKFSNLDTFDGFVSLCEDFVIPLARKADQTAPEFGTFHHASIQDTLQAKAQIVSLIFNYYARVHKPAVQAAGRTIALKDFIRFAKDFGISSCIASHQELARMFHATVAENQEATLAHWQQMLCRCAMHWGGLNVGSSSPSEIADRLSKFMLTLENSEAMISIEQWRSRTQTHKKALYRSSD